MASRFFVMQVSDLHLSARPNLSGVNAKVIAGNDDGTGWPAFSGHDEAHVIALKNWIERTRVRWQKSKDNGVHAVLFSGDLATTGHDIDLEAASNIFKNVLLPICLAPNVAGQGISVPKIIFMPGNHDRYADFNGAMGGVRFDNVFGTRFRSGGFDLNVVKPWLPRDSGAFGITVTNLENTSGDKIAIICADFSLKIPGGETAAKRAERIGRRVANLGYGECDPGTLHELEVATKNAMHETPPRAVVWALHFPPIIAADHFLQLLKHEAAERLATQLGVKLILAGHTHQSGRVAVHNEMEVWVAGSCSQFGESKGHFCHLLELEVSDGQLVDARRYNFKFRGGAGFDDDWAVEEYGLRDGSLKIAFRN